MPMFRPWSFHPVSDGEKLWVRNVKEMVLTYEGNERVKALLKKCVTSHPPCRKRKKFVHWASSLYDDAAVIEETWNIISAFRFGHLVIPETELLKKGWPTNMYSSEFITRLVNDTIEI